MGRQSKSRAADSNGHDFMMEAMETKNVERHREREERKKRSKQTNKQTSKQTTTITIQPHFIFTVQSLTQLAVGEGERKLQMGR